MQQIKCPKCGEVFRIDELGTRQLSNRSETRNLTMR